MINFLMKLFTEDFINFIAALSILMVANAITGVMKAVKSSEFNWKKLGLGIGEYIAWAISAALCVAGLQLYGGDLQITIGESTVTLLAAIEIAKKAVYVYWATKAMQNFMEYSKIDTSTVSAVLPEELDIKAVQEAAIEANEVHESTLDEEEKG